MEPSAKAPPALPDDATISTLHCGCEIVSRLLPDESFLSSTPPAKVSCVRYFGTVCASHLQHGRSRLDEIIEKRECAGCKTWTQNYAKVYKGNPGEIASFYCKGGGESVFESCFEQFAFSCWDCHVNYPIDHSCLFRSSEPGSHYKLQKICIRCARKRRDKGEENQEDSRVVIVKRYAEGEETPRKRTLSSRMLATSAST